MSAEGGLTTTGYIQHHLTNLTVCSDAARDAAGHCHGFWSFHLDTLVISGLLGLLVFGMMAKVASRASSGVPGGLQNFVEMVVGLVDQQVKDTFHGKSDFRLGVRHERHGPDSGRFFAASRRRSRYQLSEGGADH